MNDNYLEVLEQYREEFSEIRRGRGAWICEGAEGIWLLKEYRGTRQRLEFEEAVLAGLAEQGCEVDQYVRNREDQLISVSGDGSRYVLKEWFSERECSLRDIREVLTAAAWIACLHRAFRQIAWKEEWRMGSILPPELDEEMKRHSREMKRVRRFIRGKHRKTEFELCVLRHFEMFYDQAQKAQEGLELLRKTGQQRPFLCHGDLDQHHLLMRPSGVAFIEFNQMHRGSQMEDLYRFMRKVMEKHGWNEELGGEILKRYSQILPIDEADRACLYFLFLYPEKYWKQLNYYYNANKAWIPEKNVEKLKNLEAQQEGRMRFLSTLKKGIGSI